MINLFLRNLVFAAVMLSVFNHSFAGQIEDLRNLVASSDWEKAKSVAQGLTSSEPDNGEAFYLLGKALVGLGEYKSAVEALETANKIVKDDADYLVDFGYALILRGQEMNMFQAGPTFMRAMDQYKAAVELDNDHLAAHIGLSRYYMNAPAIGGGSMKKAKEHASEIARINPYLGHVEFALIAKAEKRFEDAEVEFSSAIAIKGDEAWVLFELGKLQQASNKPSEAKVSFESVLKLDPTHEEAKAALSTL